MGALLEGPVNQDHLSRLQPPIAAQAALPFSDGLSTTLVAPTVPVHALPQNVAEGAQVMEAEEVAVPALLTMSTTSAWLVHGGMNMKEATPPLGQRGTGLHPL